MVVITSSLPVSIEMQRFKGELSWCNRAGESFRNLGLSIPISRTGIELVEPPGFSEGYQFTRTVSEGEFWPSGTSQAIGMSSVIQVPLAVGDELPLTGTDPCLLFTHF